MEAHASWLARALSLNGHEVTVITARGNEFRHSSLHETHVVDAECDRWSPAWVRETARAVRAIAPDVVAAESTGANHLTHDWPTVTHLHGNHWNELTGVWQTWGRTRARHAVRRSGALAIDYVRWRPWRIAHGSVIVLTSREQRLAQTLYGASAQRTEVIGNPVSASFSQGAGARKPRIAFAGRLDPSKGPRVLLRAFVSSGLAARGYTLEYAGEGPERARLQHERDELGAGRSVLFHGRLERRALAGFLSTSKLACFPSARRESFSIGVLEAMASGCVVLASTETGVVHIERHPMAGRSQPRAAVTVPNHSPTTWAAHLNEATRDTHAMDALSDAGRRLAECFSERRVAEAIIACYERERAAKGVGAL